jgi:hypothetical protein
MIVIIIIRGHLQLWKPLEYLVPNTGIASLEGGSRFSGPG